MRCQTCHQHAPPHAQACPFCGADFQHPATRRTARLARSASVASVLQGLRFHIAGLIPVGWKGYLYIFVLAAIVVGAIMLLR